MLLSPALAVDFLSKEDVAAAEFFEVPTWMTHWMTSQLFKSRVCARFYFFFQLIYLFLMII